MLLGNDLAGSKVSVDPILCDKPIISQSTDPVEDIIPNLYPSCAVTRAMNKRRKSNLEDADDNKICDTSLPKLFDTSENTETFSTSNLITEQKNDPDISPLFQNAPDKAEAANDPI